MAGKLKNSIKPFKSSLYSDKYKFDINQRVKYLGGMHEAYMGSIGTIVKRANKKHRVDYSVLFDDGVTVNYIMQNVLQSESEQGELSEVADES